MTRLAVLSAAFISFLALTSVASAQYPPPEDAVVITVSDATPPTNSRVTLTWRVESNFSALPASEPPGGRLQAISFEEPGGGAPSCRPEIISQPGTDAGINLLRGKIRAKSTGAAELYTGSTPGPIHIQITCPSGPTGDITVMVQSAPLSISSQIDEQPTGAGIDESGAGSNDAGASQALLIGAAALIGLAGIGGAGRFLLTRKR